MTERQGTPELLEYNLGDRVRAFSTTRSGGTSVGAYAYFNITHYCGDNAEAVRQNRKLLCAELGISDNCLFLPRQVHGTEIFQVNDDFLKRSAEEREQCLDGIDALTTDIPGLCIGVSTADCIPVLLYDERHHAIAAVHAGWRGTVNRIVEKTISHMHERFGTEGKDLHAVIAPGISPEAFEVGDEVYEAFADANFPMQQIARRYPAAGESKWHIDLWAANFLQLEACGLSLSSIQVSGICTVRESSRFFSARRLGTASGRIFNGILLK